MQVGDSLKRKLFFVQGAYYFLSGLWPIFSIASFVAVTGEKTDIWLVKTLGAFIATNGLVFLLAGRRRDNSSLLGFLAVLQAVVLTFVDVWYVSRGVIPKIYLLDAGAEIVLLIFWASLVTTKKR